LKEFIEFIRKQGVVGLAVGFILGGAVSKVVSSLVEDIINPLIGLILGSAEGLSQATFNIGEATIAWGNFLGVLIDFIIIAAVVYYIFKGLGLDKLDQSED
jgi:large conductance mechanosensitive channel